MSFFLGLWGMNRSAGQTNRPRTAGQTNRTNGEVVPGQFVCSTLRFIPYEPRKKTLIPYVYNASNKDPF